MNPPPPIIHFFSSDPSLIAPLPHHKSWFRPPLLRAISFEKVGGCLTCIFKNAAGGLKIVPLLLQGGMTGRFMHCVKGKNQCWAPQKKVKNH